MEDVLPDFGADYVDYILSNPERDLQLYDPAVQPAGCSRDSSTCTALQQHPGCHSGFLTHQPPSSATQDVSVVPLSSSQPKSHPFCITLPPSSVSKQYLLKVEGEEKFLTVSRGFPFAVYFSFDGHPPPVQSEVWAVVKCREESDVQNLGPVHKCISHSQRGVKQFLVANNASVCYSQWKSHQAVKVPCSAMLVHDDMYTCVYECTCYSSCFVGRGLKKPTLIIQFTLMNKDGEVLGTDMVNLKSCSFPSRERNKDSSKRTPDYSCDSGSGVRKIPRVEVSEVSGSSPLLSNLIGDDKPDQDGFYTFTWKVKDPFIYSMLKAFRYSHTLPEHC